MIINVTVNKQMIATKFSKSQTIGTKFRKSKDEIVNAFCKNVCQL